MGEPLLGMCTTWMTQLKRDAQVPCVVRPSTFRLPEDPSVPVICISGGVGIAPFKAYVTNNTVSMRRVPMSPHLVRVCALPQVLGDSHSVSKRHGCGWHGAVRPLPWLPLPR